MSETVLAVIITGVVSITCALITQIAGMISQKTLFEYQINDLKSRMDKHNNVIERMYIMETRVDIMDERLDKLENQT